MREKLDFIKKLVLENLIPFFVLVFALGLAVGMVGYNEITGVGDEVDINTSKDGYSEEDQACVPPEKACLNGSDNDSDVNVTVNRSSELLENGTYTSESFVRDCRRRNGTVVNRTGENGSGVDCKL